MSEWINIEKKEPDILEFVLLFDKDEEICVGYRNSFLGYSHHPSGDFATGAPLFHVTHWMPLPVCPIERLQKTHKSKIAN